MPGSRGTARIATAFAAVALIAAGCSSSSGSSGGAKASSTTSAPAAPVVHAVGSITVTFVDHTRPTRPSGDRPGTDSRTLPTLILYPATGVGAADGTPRPIANARAATTGGPYPLIVFGHGFAANPQVYERLLAHWAAAGFVVAAPTFPLTSSSAPGGPDAGDVDSQPGDMSFVLDQVLKLDKAHDGPIAGLVDPSKIGAAGHSYGAVTTVGLVGNTCCRDKRIKAAAILAGDMAPYPGGTYDLVAAPPLLVVHGTDDSLIPYREGVAIFDAARGPRAMLTIKGGDHMAAAGGIGAAWNPLVARATTDFFLAYLDGDTAARARLAHDGDAQATMTDAPARGSTVTIPLPPKPTRSLHATAEPTDALANGQTITVTWSGYTAGKVVNILQCSGDDANLTNQSGCDFTNAKLLHADPTGTGSVQMQVVTGKVGTGACGAAHPGCFIVVNDASSPDPADMVKIPITFAE